MNYIIFVFLYILIIHHQSRSNANPQSKTIQQAKIIKRNLIYQQLPTFHRIHSQSFVKQGDLTLKVVQNDVGYTCSIQLGSLNQSFTVIMDTGSADLWVPSADCTSTVCRRHIRFNPSTSITATSTGSLFKIKYGSGSVESFVFRDTLQFGGYTVPQYPIGIAYEISSSFAGEPFDGILGLGFQSLSALGTPSLLDLLHSYGYIKNKRFSLFLDHAGGEASQLKFDDVDYDKVDGGFTRVDLIPNTGFWKIPIQSLSVQVLGNISSIPLDLGKSHGHAIVDTGTTVILAPKAIAKAIHLLIPGARQAGFFSSSFIFPCQYASSFTLIFEFSNVNFTLYKDNMILGAPSKDGMCTSSIQSTSGQDWILGGSFLRNFYSIWDADTKSISFGRVKTKTKH